MKKHPLLTVLFSLAAASGVMAQTLITDLGTAYTEDFTGYQGTAGTLPSPLVFTPAIEGITYNGYYTLSDPYSNLSRAVALRETSSSTDIAFGVKPSSSGVSTLDWSFKNASGAAITRLEISWDFVQYTESGRATRMDLHYSTDGSSYGTAGIIGVTESIASTRPPGVPPGGMNLPEVRTESMSITLVLNEALMPDDEITLRWNFISGTLLGDSNNNAYIGVDHISVVAIPEPGTVALLSFSAGLLAFYRRKRQARE